MPGDEGDGRVDRAPLPAGLAADRCRCPSPCATATPQAAYARRWTSRQRPVTHPRPEQRGDDHQDDQVEGERCRGRARAAGTSSRPRARPPATSGCRRRCRRRPWSRAARAARPTTGRGCGGAPGRRTAGAGARREPVASTPRTAVSGEEGEDHEAGAAVEVPQQWGRAGGRSCGALLVGRPAAGAEHGAVGRDQASGHCVAGQPGGGVVAEHDRRRAGGVGRDGGRAGTASRWSRRSGTGAPVRGSSRWWYDAPARRQRRTRVLDVARPPGSSQTVVAGLARTLGDGHGPRLAVGQGDREVTADADHALARSSPARVAATRSAAKRLAGRAEVEGGARGDPDGVVGAARSAATRRGRVRGRRRARRCRRGRRSRGRSPRTRGDVRAAGGPGRR